MFKLKDKVNIKGTDRVGIISSIENYIEDGKEKVIYEVDFIDTSNEVYKLNELELSTKEITNTLGQTKKQIEKIKQETDILSEQKRKRLEEQYKINRIITSCEQFKNKNHGKFKDGEAFWDFFYKELEATLYKEILGEYVDTSCGVSYIVSSSDSIYGLDFSKLLSNLRVG